MIYPIIMNIRAVKSQYRRFSSRCHIAELSNQFALALEMGTRLEDLANTIHVHPTPGEATMEAAMASLGHAIHV